MRTDETNNDKISIDLSQGRGRSRKKPGDLASGLNLITDSFEKEDTTDYFAEKDGTAAKSSAAENGGSFFAKTEPGSRRSPAFREEKPQTLEIRMPAYRDHRRNPEESDVRREAGQTRTRKNSGTENSRERVSKNSQGRSAGHQDYRKVIKRKKRRKKNKTLRRFLILFLLLLVVGTTVGLGYATNRMSLMKRLPWNKEEIKNTDLSEEKIEQMKGYWTIAVFGVDSRDDSIGKGNNSDVNIVANINHDTGEIKMVSVYRDTYMNISEKGYNKFNAAYMLGGPEGAVKALNKNLDLDIDDYATFSWKAVADAINILGGVDVELTQEEFVYINAFITETVEATGIASVHLKQAGMNHLDGVQAVAYGRLRLMDSDYQRTARQRKIISLALDKAKKADWNTLNCIIETVFPQVATSVEVKDIILIARTLPRYHLSETSGFPEARQEKRVGKHGFCIVPDNLSDNVIALHQFLFGDESYEPSMSVQIINNKIVNNSGVGEKVDNTVGKGPASDKSLNGNKKSDAAQTSASTKTSTSAKTN